VGGTHGRAAVLVGHLATSRYKPHFPVSEPILNTKSRLFLVILDQEGLVDGGFVHII
jgi:hypothetical protein